MGHALLGKLYKYTEPKILPLYDPNSDSDGVYKNKCLNSTAQKLVLPKKYSHSPNKTDQKWYTVISTCYIRCFEFVSKMLILRNFI